MFLVVLAHVAVLAAAAASNPSPAQVRAAVHQAERSRDVWATVNVCNSKHHPKMIGIRGEMPALGFASDMTMDITVDYWSFKDRQFKLDPNAEKRISLGSVANGLQQRGVTFAFKSPVVLAGTIKFEGRRGGKLIGQVTKPTVGGLKHVDGGDPPGYSAEQCRF
jgi:hypothetical protein